MYTLLVCVVAMLVWGSVTAYRTRKFEPILGCAMLGVIVGTLAAMMIGSFAPKGWHVAETTGLAAMRSSAEATGIFVRGTGSVDTRLVYRVMVRNADGSMSPFSIEANRETVRIKEVPELTENGRMTVEHYMQDPNWWLGNWSFVKSTAQSTHYALEVPKGTVRVSFEVE